jgi:hypothetical protein
MLESSLRPNVEVSDEQRTQQQPMQPQQPESQQPQQPQSRQFPVPPQQQPDDDFDIPAFMRQNR